MILSKLMLLSCLAVLAVSAIGCAATSSKPAPENLLDDDALASVVKAAIIHEPSLRTSEITIESSGGVVRLHGVVISVLDRLTAVETARKVHGVVGVRSDMTVQEQP